MTDTDFLRWIRKENEANIAIRVALASHIRRLSEVSDQLAEHHVSEHAHVQLLLERAQRTLNALNAGQLKIEYAREDAA